MLDMTTAKLVKKAIDDQFCTERNAKEGPFSLDDVIHMDLICGFGEITADLVHDEYGADFVVANVIFNKTSGVCSVTLEFWY